jgi:1,4-alpha-glucan branching enzyme
MIEKHPGADTVQVTFRVPTAAGAARVSVVGEFNDWDPERHVLSPVGDDAYETTVALAPGRSYRFRYLLDGARWENDWAADAYAPNEFGGDDSVVDLTDAASAATPAAPKTKRRSPRRSTAATA